MCMAVVHQLHNTADGVFKHNDKQGDGRAPRGEKYNLLQLTTVEEHEQSFSAGNTQRGIPFGE